MSPLPQQKILTVALTGGIGSGKTTVADRLAGHGAAVIDTDQLARELTAPGQPLVYDIAAVFGSAVLSSEGEIDRAALRRLVFSDAEARKRLESILHPPIRALMLERLAAVTAPYAVLVIPLLFETGQETLADRVLVVDAPELEQIRRVQARSRLTSEEIRSIMATQVARGERLRRADDVIDNGGDLRHLWQQVDRIHQLYLGLAKQGDLGKAKQF